MRPAWLLGLAIGLVNTGFGCSDGDSGGGSGTGGAAGDSGSSGRGGSGQGGSSGKAGAAGKGGTAGQGGSAGKGGSGGQSGSAGKGGTGGTAGKGGAAGQGGAAGGGGLVTYGQTYEGGEFHLGPVDWEETEWHNACAPPGTQYRTPVRQAEGQLLAALWDGIPDVARYCDACIYVTTARGKSALLRVVSYGMTTPNSIDVSPPAWTILNSGEYPRLMSWQFAKCPDTGKVMYEFKVGAHESWTPFWVRNARVPIRSVEVRSATRPSFVAVARKGDGTLDDNNGFGVGPFSIRVTAVDGQQIADDFAWPSAGISGQLLTGQGNFQ